MAESIGDKVIRKWYLWLPLLFYFIFKDRWGETSIYVSTQWITFYYFIIILIWALNEQGKYASPQLVVNNDHICVRQPVIAGDWAIFTDFIDAPAFFMTYALNSKSIVIPTKSIAQVGQNYFSTARVVKQAYNWIPYHAQQVIASNNYNRENVYFGQMSETVERILEDELKGKNESLEWIKEQLTIQRDLATKNRDSAQMNLGDIEGIKSSFDRMLPKDETFFEKITAVDENEKGSGGKDGAT